MTEERGRRFLGRSTFAVASSPFLLPRSTARRDIALVLAMLVLGFVGSVYFEPFEAVASFDRAHPIWHFDDVATALVFVSFGLLWLAARRAHDAAIGARAAVHAIELEHAYQALGQQARALEQTAGELALGATARRRPTD
jgi:hypothetical protein